jgi:prepilin-type N-terminal cleavage/methylation domain-containing protein
VLKCMARVCPFIFLRSRKGSTLLEVLIAVAVLGLITASIFPVFIMLNKAEFKWTQQTVSESLIRTQVEYIKGCPYIYGNSSAPNPPYDTVPPPDPSYEIDVVAQPIHIDTSTTPPGHWDLPAGQDEGIQKITIQIKHVGNLVTSVTNYKVDRP